MHHVQTASIRRHDHVVRELVRDDPRYGRRGQAILVLRPLGAVIERVAKKKLLQLGDLDPLVLRRRLFAFLARRGYDLDEIKAVVTRLAP